MAHPLKIYSIYSIALNNIKIDNKEIPKDLHEFIKDFTKFFKLDHIQSHINNFIIKFNEKRNELLTISTENELLEVVKYIINQKSDLYKLEYDAFFIENLAELNKLNIVKYLIQNGANYDFKTISYLTICYNNLDILKWLYTRVNPNNDDRDILLEYAAQNDFIDIVKYLVEDCNANIITTKLPFGKTKSEAIINAANNGNYDILKYLVNKINIVATNFDEQNSI